MAGLCPFYGSPIAPPSSHPPTPPPRTKGGHPSAVLSWAMQPAEPSLCSPSAARGQRCRASHSLGLMEKRLDPWGHQEQIGLCCTLSSNLTARSEYIKTQRPWQKPQSLDDI